MYSYMEDVVIDRFWKALDELIPSTYENLETWPGEGIPDGYIKHYALKRLKAKRGFRTEKNEEREFYVRTCGNRGKVEIYEDGSRRYLPNFCGEKSLCIHCHLKGKNRQRFNQENRIMAVVKAMGVKRVLFPVFTLPVEVSRAIWADLSTKGVKFLNELSALAVGVMKDLLFEDIPGARGSVGIISSVHLIGASNPFKPHVHFHLACIPLSVSLDGKSRELPYLFEHDKAKMMWLDAVGKFCFKHGIKAPRDKIVLKLAYVKSSDVKGIRFKLRYMFRSLTQDVFESVYQIRADFKEFVWVERVKNKWTPYLAKIKKLEDALQVLMKPGYKTVKPYGYFVNLRKYSTVLGLRQAEYKQEGEIINRLPCEFKREYKRNWFLDKMKQPDRVVITAKYEGEDWHVVPLALVVGELCSGPNIKRWVPKHEGDKWNFWDPP